MVQQVIHSHLLPTLTQSTSSLTDTLLTELKSEMLQIRKELTPIPPPVAPEAKRGVAEDEVLNKLQEMSQQMEALQTVVKDIQGKNFNGINHAQSVPNLPTTQGSPPPIQNTRLPTPAQLEDTFLAALTAQTVPATLQLVDDHLGLTDYCLPVSGKSPLSQAVLLTLLHRVSPSIDMSQATRDQGLIEKKLDVYCDCRNPRAAPFIPSSRYLDQTHSQPPRP